jgi:hypothetical protein
MPATASSILDLFCVAPAARLLAQLPVAPAPISLSQVAVVVVMVVMVVMVVVVVVVMVLVAAAVFLNPHQEVEKPNFFPKTAAFDAKPAAPAAAVAAGDGSKEKKAPPVVTVVTSGEFDVWCVMCGV